jgi:hypothetical protein
MVVEGLADGSWENAGTLDCVVGPVNWLAIYQEVTFSAWFCALVNGYIEDLPRPVSIHIAGRRTRKLTKLSSALLKQA